MAAPIPASATVLLICGVMKLISAALCILGGILAFVGGAAWTAGVSDGTSGGNFAGGLGALIAGGLGAVLFCAGSAILVSGVLDTAGGVLARKGRASGRVIGIISAVLGLLGSFGSLSGPLMRPDYGGAQADASSGLVGGLFGFLIVGGLNLYLLVSFIRNGEAFKS